MKEELEALYREVEANEEHVATINRYLDQLERGRKNAKKARDLPLLRAIEKEITDMLELRARKHTERRQLSRDIKRVKGG